MLSFKIHAAAASKFKIIPLLLVYLLVGLAHAGLAPLTTGPDELAHYEYARFIADRGRLPGTYDERSQASYKSDQPPLYHLIAALPMRLVDPAGPPYLKRVGDHPRRQLIERTRHAWGIYNTEDEAWPYRAEVLRWQAGRWVAILFGAATVAVTFFLARDLFAALPPPLAGRFRPDLAALGAAMIVAFTPRFVLTGSMLNYETTLAFVAALFLWALIRLATASPTNFQLPTSTLHPPPSTPLGGAVQSPPSKFKIHPPLLGFLAGLAITAKLSALILPLELAVALWLIGRQQGWSRRAWAGQLLAGLAGTGLAISWWFGFILYRFNTVTRDGLWAGLLRPLIAADASDATTNRLLSFLTGGQAGFSGAIDNLDSGPPSEWLLTFFRTFWMVGIETVYPLAPAALLVALAICLLAAAGLITAWRRDMAAGPGRPARLLLALLLIHLAAPLILPLLRYAATASLADTAQGRHVLFSAAPAFAVLLIWGLGAVLRGSGPALPSPRQEGRLDGGGGAGQRAGDSAMQGRRTADEGSAPPRAEQRTSTQPPLEPDNSKLKIQNSRFGSVKIQNSKLLLPGLLLLLWTGAQVQAMTWAYLPPLPVRTAPEAAAQAAQRLDRTVTGEISLLGYSDRFEADGRLLRLDLLWQAAGVSPVDYLAEVSLLDEAGAVRGQWLGYPAGGRYPVRAWDKGDIVRDTAWLPLAGLPPGPYRLQLNLLPVTVQPPEPAAPGLALAGLTLPETPLRRFNGSLPFTGRAASAGGYSVWQDGRPLTAPATFRFRETILVTLSPLLPDQERVVRLLGPAGDGARPQFAPVRELDGAVLFIVGPDWPGGDYALQVTVRGPGEPEQQVNSGVVANVVDRWQRQFARPAISRPVEANFANQVELLGYDLGANRARAGEGFPLTLYWQSLDWLNQDYTIFTSLLAADQAAYGGRDRLPREGYRTIYWAPGEIIADPFGVPVAADAPDGVYYLHVGLYRQVGQEAVALPLVRAGRPLDASSVTIGPLKVGGPPAGATLPAAQPQVALDQPFGDAPHLTLLGYDLADQAGQPIPTSPAGIQNSKFKIQNLTLTLYWRSEAILPLDYTTFVHVIDEAGKTVAQQDQPPLNGAYPTSLWDPGEVIADDILIPLPAGLPGGMYQVVVGMYDFQTGRRLTVPGSPANEVILANVAVP